MTRYAYCEGVWATPTSPVHIRASDRADDSKLGGGIRGIALCGRNMNGGWDLAHDVAHTIGAHQAIPQDQPGRLCLACVAQYEQDVTP